MSISTTTQIAPETHPDDPTAAYFTSPTFGALGVGLVVDFQWTAVPGATGYELQVGSAPETSDVFDSQVISTLEQSVSLPAGMTNAYARVRAIVPGDPALEPAGHWIHGSNVTFRVDQAVTGTTLSSPAPGGRTAVGAPIVWTTDPVAISYRLRLGTSPGGNDVDDSGPVRVDRRLVSYSGSAQILYATLDTNYSSLTLSRQFQFRAAATTPNFANRLALARVLTAQVHESANVDNEPYTGTLIHDAAVLVNRAAVTCTDYASALVAALSQANIGLQARAVDVCLNPNSYDCHELVEVLDPDSARWVTLDPTFGLAPLRADGAPATVEEISAAVRSLSWSALQFDFLTPRGNAYATGYYIDYPLLFVDVYARDGSGLEATALSDLTPYFSYVGTSLENAWDSYAIACAPGYESVTVNKDGAIQSFPCMAGTGMSQVMLASSLEPVPGDPSFGGIWQPRRFAF